MAKNQVQNNLTVVTDALGNPTITNNSYTQQGMPATVYVGTVGTSTPLQISPSWNINTNVGYSTEQYVQDNIKLLHDHELEPLRLFLVGSIARNKVIVGGTASVNEEILALAAVEKEILERSLLKE